MMIRMRFAVAMQIEVHILKLFTACPTFWVHLKNRVAFSFSNLLLVVLKIFALCGKMCV